MRTRAEFCWAGCNAVERAPQSVTGTWVFRGIRVPVAALFENLEDGISLAEFLELFAGVTPESARLVAHASSVQSRSRNYWGVSRRSPLLRFRWPDSRTMR
ncbi:DUF433 domain-containing protein [Synechococcus sp. CBW1108]|nr:DUF433 domain-containing protein [Synechococcus sp. CBW1108]